MRVYCRAFHKSFALFRVSIHIHRLAVVSGRSISRMRYSSFLPAIFLLFLLLQHSGVIATCAVCSVWYCRCRKHGAPLENACRPDFAAPGGCLTAILFPCEDSWLTEHANASTAKLSCLQSCASILYKHIFAFCRAGCYICCGSVWSMDDFQLQSHGQGPCMKLKRS